MAIDTSISRSSASSAIWGQLQQQQAQRVADQAEQNARALQQKARQAESDASRAQDRARTVRVEYDKAQQGADSARQTLVSMDSAGKMYEELGRRVNSVNERLTSEVSGSGGRVVSPPVPVSAVETLAASPAAAVGSTINVTA